jgi:hypothetical protein
VKKPPRTIVIDEESFRRARERPEAKEALKRLTGHIVESFAKSIPREELPLFEKYFKTREGQKLLVELWPQIVDTYLKALCAHPRKPPPQHS